MQHGHRRGCGTGRVSATPYGVPKISASGNRVFLEFGTAISKYGEHIINSGRRSAKERVAHFLLEMWIRLRTVGVADEKSYLLPLSQELIADVIGLSVPYTNQTIKQFEADGLVEIADHRVTIRDPEGMVTLAGFDEAYLTCGRIPQHY